VGQGKKNVKKSPLRKNSSLRNAKVRFRAEKKGAGKKTQCPNQAFNRDSRGAKERNNPQTKTLNTEQRKRNIPSGPG